MLKLSPLPLRNVVIDDAFWSERISIARKTSIDYMWRALNDEIPGVAPSRCIRNFKIAAGHIEGEFEGFRFQDSDLYKWLEAVAYSLETSFDAGLKQRADDAIALIGEAQLENGYIDTYIMLNNIEKWSDTCRAHELYCAGHMIEAAVAYKHATGSNNLLTIARKFANHIYEVFGEGENQIKGYPGHQEIELALHKLYKETGDGRYLKLAKFFLDRRGEKPHYYDIEQDKRIAKGEDPIDYFHDHGVEPYSYQQAHRPVREQDEAVGHAVRCVYMLSGMVDVGADVDKTLLDAAKHLYDNIVNTQMYITGGIGSMCDGEAFTFPYDLPNDRMYNETCASIGLMMACQRLLNLDGVSRYADTMERALYNTVLAGVSLDGKGFFYINPMEMWPERSLRRHDMKEIVPVRQGWYGCACCPPNVLRTLLGLGQYVYSLGGDSFYVNLFVGSAAKFEINGESVELTQRGGYPNDGKVTFEIKTKNPVKFKLRLRVPRWCKQAAATVNGEALDVQKHLENGFVVIDRTFSTGDTVELDMPMTPEFVYCDDRVPYNAGKAAVQRGPLVYCTEEIDNGSALWNLEVDVEKPFKEVSVKDTPPDTVALTVEGYCRKSREDSLYTNQKPQYSPTPVTLVPYFMWGNRKAGEMSVWQNISHL